ncbi:MAG: hypothetical protein V3U80_03610 [Flavobacteriaceae bacterium]
MHKEPQSFLNKVFDFYIFSNIHVAIATFSLTKITLLNIGISENKTALFVFFSTILSYNGIRFLRLNSIDFWYKNWIKSNKKTLLFLNVIALLALLYLSFNLRLKAILILIPFSLATLFYTFPTKKFALRNIAGLKLFLIAFTWVGITVIFPLIQNYLQLQTNEWLTVFQQFLFVIAITLPFDIRDVDLDDPILKTIPQQVGVYKTKVIGILLLILFFFLEFTKQYIQAKTLLILLIISSLSVIFLVNSTKNQSKYYSSFFVESVPIIWFALLWMTSNT